MEIETLCYIFTSAFFLNVSPDLLKDFEQVSWGNLIQQCLHGNFLQSQNDGVLLLVFNPDFNPKNDAF